MTLASSTVKDFLNGKKTEITEKSRSPPRTWSKTTQPAAIAQLRDGGSQALRLGGKQERFCMK